MSPFPNHSVTIWSRRICFPSGAETFMMGSLEDLMKQLLKFTLVACCVALVPLSAKATTFQVQVGQGGLKFTPANVMIQVGDTVQWVWSGLTLHSTTSGTPAIPTGCGTLGLITTGSPSGFTFTTAGTFNYFCTPHGACCGMIGSVMVTQAIDTVAITKATWSSSQMLLTVAATDTKPNRDPDVLYRRATGWYLGH